MRKKVLDMLALLICAFVVGAVLGLIVLGLIHLVLHAPWILIVVLAVAILVWAIERVLNRLEP